MTAQSQGTQRRRPHGGISLNAFILVSLVVFLGGGLAVMNPTPPVLTFAFIMAAWVLSVVAHEFGHAFAALRAGDYSVVGQGYLSLDPLKYAHPLTTIIIPMVFIAIGGIAFPGGAVYLREDLMKSPGGRAMASLAGPLGTLAVLMTIAVALYFGGEIIPTPLASALAFLAYLQAMALILNLLPIPGLDGYGVIRPFLPDSVRAMLQPIEPFAFMGLFAILIMTDAGALLSDGAAIIANSLGVPLVLAQLGMEDFYFWK